MGRINSGNAEAQPANNGGVLDINTITRQTAQPVQPKSTGVAIAETLERVLNMPNMQPVLQQGARFIGEYANKLALQNQAKISKQNTGNTQQPDRKPVFGVGADQP